MRPQFAPLSCRGLHLQRLRLLPPSENLPGCAAPCEASCTAEFAGAFPVSETDHRRFQSVSQEKQQCSSAAEGRCCLQGRVADGRSPNNFQEPLSLAPPPLESQQSPQAQAAPPSARERRANLLIVQIAPGSSP